MSDALVDFDFDDKDDVDLFFDEETNEITIMISNGEKAYEHIFNLNDAANLSLGIYLMLQQSDNLKYWNNAVQKLRIGTKH